MEQVSQLPLKLFKSETRETVQVLSLVKSIDEDYVALISGRKLIKDQKALNQIFIFKRSFQAGNPESIYQYSLHKRCVIKGKADFDGVCSNFVIARP